MSDDTQDDTQEATFAPKPVRKERQDIALCSQLVAAEGVPQFALDERTIWRRTSYKGYHVVFGWVMDPGPCRPEAAITIIPEVTPAEPGAWVITRRAIGEFSDEHNRPTQRCFAECTAALPILGYDTIKAEVFRLVDTVMYAVDDLVLMPTCPLGVALMLQGDPIWDVTVHAVGEPNKVLRETTI
jgi:hypothetical protein